MNKSVVVILVVFSTVLFYSCSTNSTVESTTIANTDNAEITAQTESDTAVVKNSSAAAMVTENTDNAKPLIPNDKPAKKIVTDGSTAKNSIDVVGKYAGTLPCTDCSGITTKLILKGDNSYTLSVFYQGKTRTLPIETNGIWKWIDDFNIELVDEKNIKNKFFVAENRLEQLDANGKRVNANMQNNVGLKKQSF